MSAALTHEMQNLGQHQKISDTSTLSTNLQYFDFLLTVPNVLASSTKGIAGQLNFLSVDLVQALEINLT